MSDFGKEDVVQEIEDTVSKLNAGQLDKLISVMEKLGSFDFDMGDNHRCFYGCVGEAIGANYFKARKMVYPDSPLFVDKFLNLSFTPLEKYYMRDYNRIRKAYGEILAELKNIRDRNIETKELGDE